MSEFFSILSGLAMIGVVIAYFFQVSNGSSTPNPATWIIWFVVMFLNTSTYYFVSMEDLWLIVPSSIITLGMFFLIIYSYKKGRIGKLGVIEVITLSLVIVIGLFWAITRKNIPTNMMIQATLVIGFIPTICRLLKNELKENPISWILAVISYCFLIFSILNRSEWRWVQLVYPVANGIIGNGSIAVIAFLKNKKQCR